MKSMIQTTLAFILSFNLSAQSVISDTINLFPGYTHQVWYSFENGVVSSASKDEWHLAFELSGFGSTIRINGAIGMELFAYPERGAEFWEIIDTIGLEFWDQQFNSIEDWSLGAFSAGRNINDDFDMGWGRYSIVTHTIVGDQVFVLNDGRGNFYKIFVENLSMGTYNFIIANLDGTEESSYSVSKQAYSGKNFVYFSIDNRELIDREPPSETWDLSFGQYVEQIPSSYVVVGVLQNIGVEAYLDKDGGELAGFTYTPTNDFSQSISSIGYDWKRFDLNSFSWNLEDKWVYVVKDRSGSIWALKFTDFGGSGSGIIEFDIQLLELSTSVNEVKNEMAVKLFPNPATEFIHVTIKSNSVENDLNILLLDMNGKAIRNIVIDKGHMNLQNHQHTIYLTGLPAGLYTLLCSVGSRSELHKVIVK